MKITSITISHGITVNLGNYESERYDVTLTADIGEDDKTAADQLRLEAARLLALQLVERLKQKQRGVSLQYSKNTPEHNRAYNHLASTELTWIERLHRPYAQQLLGEFIAKEAK